MNKRILSAGLAALLSLSACATDADGTLDDAVAGAVEGAESITDTTLTSGAADAIAKLQTSLGVLTTQMEASAVAPQLDVAWAELRARVTDAAVAAQMGSDIDTGDLEVAVDSFESRMGEIDAEPALRDAWAEFRAMLAEFVAEFSA
jgi:hypothetical protein